QALRAAIIPLWSAYSFFTLYANIDGYRAQVRVEPRDALDRYILAKTRSLVEELTRLLDANDLPAAYGAVPGYVDALNDWFIRPSRARFWREGLDADKQAAYDTLYTALTIVCRALAPLIPFVMERIYKGLTGEVSVHLSTWPEVDSIAEERGLVSD